MSFEKSTRSLPFGDSSHTIHDANLHGAMVDPRRAHHTNESAQSNHLRIDERFCHILDLPVRCLEKILPKKFPQKVVYKMVIYQGTLVEVTFKSKTFKP